jgi:eight-cysteine-cluster-containing protein
MRKRVLIMEVKDLLMIACTFAAAGLFVYALYYFGMQLAAGGHGEGNVTENATGNASLQKALLLGSMQKFANSPSYTYVFGENADGHESVTTTASSPAFRAYMINTSIYARMALSNGTDSVICVYFGRKASCSDAPENSSLMRQHKALISSVPGVMAAIEEKRMGILERAGGLEFTGPAVRDSVGGIECNRFSYRLDYSVLTLSDLNDMGISPSAPVVLYYSNYTAEYCIDDSYDVLTAKFNYSMQGARKGSQTTALSHRWNQSSLSDFPVVALSPANETEALFLDALSAEASVNACAKTADRDLCVRTYAIDQDLPYMCLSAGKMKDSCILLLATRDVYPEMCQFVGNLSLRDDCWTEMAARLNQSSYCANVLDAAKVEYCRSLTAGNWTAAASGCKTDSDCVETGCSGELCVEKSQGGVNTICIFKPEYACLKATTCKCDAGSCGWAKNAAYLSCLNGLNVTSG